MVLLKASALTAILDIKHKARWHWLPSKRRTCGWYTIRMCVVYLTLDNFYSSRVTLLIWLGCCTKEYEGFSFNWQYEPSITLRTAVKVRRYRTKAAVAVGGYHGGIGRKCWKTRLQLELGSMADCVRIWATATAAPAVRMRPARPFVSLARRRRWRCWWWSKISEVKYVIRPVWLQSGRTWVEWLQPCQRDIQCLP